MAKKPFVYQDAINTNLTEVVETKKINEPKHTEKHISDSQIVNIDTSLKDSNRQIIHTGDALIETQYEVATNYEQYIEKRLKSGQTIPALDAAQTIASYYRLTESVINKISINPHASDTENNFNFGLFNKTPYQFIGLNDNINLNFDKLFHACTSDAIIDIIKKNYQSRYLTANKVDTATLAKTKNRDKISSLTQTKQFLQQVMLNTLSITLNYSFSSRRQLRINKWFENVKTTITPPQSVDTRIPAYLMEGQNNLENIKKNIVNSFNKGISERKSFIENDFALKSKIKNKPNLISYYEVIRFNHDKRQIDFQINYLLTTAFHAVFSGIMTNRFKTSYSISILNIFNKITNAINEHDELRDSFIQCCLDGHRHHYPMDQHWHDNKFS